MALRKLKRPLKQGAKKSTSPVSSSTSEDDIFVGIDMSLTDTGLVLLASSGEVLRAVSIKTTAEMLDLQRLRHIVNNCVGQITSFGEAHRIFVAIEALPFARRPSGKSYTRAEVLGVLKWELTRLGYPVHLISATTLKKQFAGKGNKDKAAIQNACLAKYNLVISNENVADALACADTLKRYIIDRVRFPLEKMPVV